MSELGDIWREVKKEQQEKRWNNYDSSKQQLIDNQVSFVEKANGHFIINDSFGKPRFDFWATTGLIIERKTKKRRRGVRNLIRWIHQEG